MSASIGHWWRFADYEIENGFIRPREGAELTQFDPWSAWTNLILRQGTTKLSRLIIAPLTEIVHSLCYDSYDPGDYRPIGDIEQKLILDWVVENGLLGLLVHDAETVRLAPRWRTAECWSREIGPDEQGFFSGGTQATVKIYFRDGDRWTEHIEEVDSQYTNKSVILRREFEGQLVPETQLAEADKGGRAQIKASFDKKPRIETLNQTWAEYFPTVPEAEREVFDYPLPLTDSFWRLYAEPLPRFLHTCAHLTECAESLAQAQAERRGKEYQPEPFGDAESIAVTGFRGLIRNIHPQLSLDDEGRLSLTWAAPSLLASLAMMTTLQLTADAGRVVGICEKCRIPFVSGDLRAKYCSLRCRRVMQKRNQRMGLEETRG